MVSEDTQKAIWICWTLYIVPFGGDAEAKLAAQLDELDRTAPEPEIRILAGLAFAYWQGFMAADIDKTPKLAAARLRKVDKYLKKLVCMVVKV